jgi:tetratricopeptide (TPR) repeat protein
VKTLPLLLGATCVALGAGASSAADDRASAPVSVDGADAPAASSATLALTPGDAWDDLCLRRAVARWTAGDVAGALDALAEREAVDAPDRVDLLGHVAARHLHDPRPRPTPDDGDIARWVELLSRLDRGDASAAAELAGANDRDEALLAASEAAARAGDPADARAARRALAYEDLRNGRWSDALERLDDVERSWRDETALLRTLLADVDAQDAMWNAWSAPRPGDVVVDAAPTERALAGPVEAALDLRHDFRTDAPPKVTLRAAAVDVAPGLAPPDALARAEADRLGAELEDARADHARAERGLEAAEQDLLREQSYFGLGKRRVDAEIDSTDDVIRRLDVLRARTDEIVAALDAVRDAELLRIAQRTQAFLDTARDQRLVAQAMLRFRVGTERRQRLPEGVPSPADLLYADDDLVQDLETWFTSFAEAAAELTRRSHDEVWVPRATNGVDELVALAARRRGEETTLAAAIDSMRTRAADPLRLAAARGRLDNARLHILAVADSLRDERRRVVRTAALARSERLAAEGEGLLYAAAIAAHEDALAHAAAAHDDASRTDARARLADADRRWDAFLTDFADAPARDEAMFRLADVRLQRAHEDFRVAMEGFLGGREATTGGDARALAPFVDYGPALALYRQLLTDSPGFPHRDAVLFHVGMILSDDGDPQSRAHLEELVSSFPDSRHAQEAHLRLADDRFAEKDFRSSVRHYEAAAAGANAEQAAIALYKLGWAHSNLEQHDASAESFRRLLDLYAAEPEAARTTDLRDEASDHLVHALARAGGAPAFERLFAAAPDRPYEARTLTDLGHVLRQFSLFEEAVAADSLWLDRYPLDPGALDAGQRMVATLETSERPDRARESRLALADRFRHGSAWSRATDSDSLRQAGDEWSRTSIGAVALHHHQAARGDGGTHADWRRAMDLYETLIAGWPDDGSTPRTHYHAGEAAAALDEPRRAIDHFEAAAAADTASFRVDAAWQAIAVRDTWYEKDRHALAGADGTAPEAGPDPLARELLTSIDSFAAAHAADARTADLVWRKANVARAHAWRGDAIDGFRTLVDGYPTDERRPAASRLLADALYDAERFPEAADAYDTASLLTAAAGDDSTATVLAARVPHCHDREAHRVAEKHGDGAQSAALFERLAATWPDYEHSPRALYRAGLGWQAADRAEDAVRAWTTLADAHPDDALARDARLNVARTWEQADRPEAAADAYRTFADAFPDDADAGAALLTAADLFASSGNAAASETSKTLYLDRFPDDVDARFEILGERAVRELDTLGDSPISGLLALGADGAATSNAGHYLELATEHPDQASASLLARVRFLRGEESRSAYERARISLPLAPSVAEKKSLLENVLQEYQGAAAYERAPWNRAAALRIGECLVEFGDALMECDAPADLGEDDRIAFAEVLEEQSWEFFDRGEEAWTQLVRQAGDDPDEWVEEARRRLWPRVARRFLHRPEVEYPLVTAQDPPTEAAP